MSHLIWYIDIFYDELVKLFGQSLETDGYKVDAGWEIKTPRWEFYIYNYKNWVNYCWEEEWIPTKEIRDWHIWWDKDEDEDIDYIKWYIDWKLI